MNYVTGKFLQRTTKYPRRFCSRAQNPYVEDKEVLGIILGLGLYLVIALFAIGLILMTAVGLLELLLTALELFFGVVIS